MTTAIKKLSPTRIRRLKQQGYLSYTDEQLSDLAYGNRFAYRLCSAMLLVGVLTANFVLLGFMFLIAMFGFILPNHPFDYVYNYFFSERLGMAKLPPRSKQLKFTCFIATLWIGATMALFYTGYSMGGYIMGAMLFGMALIVATTDYCMPSIIYNWLFGVKI